MDAYDYDEDALTTVARSCSFPGYRRTGGRKNLATDISCADCRYWHGTGCSLGRFDSIASETGLE